MEISNKSSITLPQTAAQQKATTQAWQVGQMLKGVVVENLQNSVKLRVDSTLLQAPTTKQHQRGETLLLTVLRSGDKPLLQVSTPQLSTPQTSQVVQDSALKVLLPKQAPLTLLLANLSVISQLKTQLAAPLTMEVSNSVKKLLENIVPSDRIGDPKELRRAIFDSGILLEKKLADLSPLGNKKSSSPTALPQALLAANHGQVRPVTQDLKANLMQLLEVLRAPPLNQNNSAKIPLPLQAPLATAPPNTIGSTQQVPISPQALTQSAKENLLRILMTPANLAQGEEVKRLAQSSQFAALTSSLSRLPIPFFRHAPLQPQKSQQPTLLMLQHREQIIDELVRQVEGSIARVQLSQLASMPQDHSSQPSWTLEFPLRHGDNVDIVQLRLEKEAPQDDEKESRWRVTLTLDLPKIGTLYATITVCGESASATLWAEEAETAKLIDSHLQLLRDALEQQGVVAGEIRCQQGSPPAPPHQPRHTLLVDTRV